MKREREESTGEEAEEPTAQRARDDAGADESADAPPNTEVAATGTADGAAAADAPPAPAGEAGEANEGSAAADATAPASSESQEPAAAAESAPAAPQPTLDDEKIAALLRERTDAKARRDFAQADALRATLEQHGIKINDARQLGMVGTWTDSNGRRGNLTGPDFFLDPLVEYTESAARDAMPPGATISNADLIAQLQARSEARSRRDFTTSDAIRTALEAHGIKITDSTKSWIANDGRKGNLSGPDFFSVANTPFAPGAAAAAGARSAYPPPPYGAPPPGYPYGYPPPPGADGGAGGMSTDAIYAKLHERQAARLSRDFARADALRDELRRLGVNIDDKARTWSTADGRTGAIDSGRGGGGASAPPQPPAAAYPPPGYGQYAAYGYPPPAAGQYAYPGYGQQPAMQQAPPGYGQPPPQPYAYGAQPPYPGQGY